MDKKFILPIVLLTLVSLAFLVSAENWFYNVGSSQNDYQLTIEVKEGWNLIQGFHPNFISAGSQVNSGNIKAVFMYSPDKNKYIETYPENKLPTSGLSQSDEYYDDNAGLYSYWVYVDNLQTCNDPACEIPGGRLNKLVYTIRIVDLTNIQLKNGWNFVGINPTMLGKSMNEIKNDCEINKIYLFDEANNQWGTILNLLDSKTILEQEAEVGKGFLIKVSADCTLKTNLTEGSSSNINPPQIPQ
jgi:hypothetical protein